MTDGSDEPWGIVAAVTVAFLVAREWRTLRAPSDRALLACAGLALAAATASLVAPPLFAAAVAMLALATFLNGARPHEPAAPLATLLLLALPVIATLQFYLGYPLRWLTAHAAAPLLSVAGLDVRAAGAALQWGAKTILVDPPCAGIGMLWIGSYAAALFSHMQRADALRTLANGAAAAAIVFAANVARNTALFFPETRLVDLPEGFHPAIGLAAMAGAIVSIFAVVHRKTR